MRSATLALFAVLALAACGDGPTPMPVALGCGVDYEPVRVWDDHWACHLKEPEIPVDALVWTSNGYLGWNDDVIDCIAIQTPRSAGIPISYACHLSLPAPRIVTPEPCPYRDSDDDIGTCVQVDTRVLP